MDDGHNFFVPKFTAATGATITVEQIGGKSGAVTLDSDGLVIVQLTTDPCILEVIATKGAIVEKRQFKVDLIRESE